MIQTQMNDDMNFDKMYGTDLRKLSDKELATYIDEVKKERLACLIDGDINAAEFSVILMIAAAEQNNRSSTKVAKRALYIAAASLFVTALCSALQVCWTCLY